MEFEDRLSESLEDYLEAIFHIVEEKKAAKAKDIAKRLDVNSSSVTGALRALSKRGLVNYAPYDLITLTDEGEKIAEDIVQRHRYLRKFLSEVLKVEEKEAEENACRMEHVISPDVLIRIHKLVDFIEDITEGKLAWSKQKGFTL